MRDARAFMVATMRHQVGFAAAVAHARLRLSRLEIVGHSGRTAGRYASAAAAFISPKPPLSSRAGHWAAAEAVLALLVAACSDLAAERFGSLALSECWFGRVPGLGTVGFLLVFACC
jgi:hypothetical protein